MQRALIEARCGWDVTDYGGGDFDALGLALFTLRNGRLADLQRGGGMCYENVASQARESKLEAQLEGTPHKVLELSLRDFRADLEAAASAAAAMLPGLRASARERCAASALVVAQQCGGSDAFSGSPSHERMPHETQ